MEIPRLLRNAGWAGALVTTFAQADGSGIDKVYDPYVQLLEHELEYRALYQDDDAAARDGVQLHRFGYGQTLAEGWFAEFYAIGENPADGGFDVNAYELELKHQLTEQGEYAADWGVLLELERSTALNAWEAVTTLIAQRDWTRWTGVVNASLIYEWGGGIDPELETGLKAQLRYRYDPLLEPAFELYSGESSKGAGPMLLGNWRIGQGRNLHWEAGAIFGLDGDTADISYKAGLEYEF